VTSADGLQLLRPALEAAWAVARLGEQQQPKIDAPRPLRPFLRFARLPDRALGITRRTVDDDAEFRSRIVPVADEDVVGRAGFLFLVRPEGWQAELDELIAVAADAESAESDEQQERTARRRLRSAEEARRKAEAALEASTAGSARVAEELQAERRARQQAEARLAGAAAELDRLRAESGSFRASAERARARHDELRREVERLESELAAARTDLDAMASLPPAVPVDPVVEPPPLPQPAAEPAQSSFDVAVLGAAITQASEAFDALGRALRTAASALTPAVHPGERATDEAPCASGATGDTGAVAPATARTPPAPRRSPAPLPPAVFDDTAEAADYLVRLNGVVVLVDGYNVSKLRWPELEIAEQRRRLADALAELAARTGADVHVVFDGIEQVDRTLPPGPRRPVRISFSPPDVEADDVIVGLVGDVPLHRPVVVASSDRRVQTEAARRGANVVSSQQLLAVLGR
jgi:predicted RNA-binding protein with PIN domain